MKKLNCILLIDDNAHTNFFNKRIIQKLGLAEEVYAAENGKLGLDYITHQGKFNVVEKQFPKPDLIFLDINMPVMDGWEFLSEYHNLPAEQKADILLIMLTTSPNPDDMDKALALPDVDGFRRKPVTAEMLTDIMEEYFEE